MSEENRQSESKPRKSRLYQGEMPKLGGDLLRRIMAAQEEIDKLPYGSENPKAIEIAKKYGLKGVPG